MSVCRSYIVKITLWLKAPDQRKPKAAAATLTATTTAATFFTGFFTFAFEKGHTKKNNGGAGRRF